jgi:hypothetical protein
MKLPVLKTVEEQEADERDKFAAEVRAARIDLARRNWREIDPPERLVARGFGWLVDSETDYIFVRRRGTTFEPGRAAIMSGEGFDLWFFLDAAGDVVPLERVPSPKTWSEHVERQARRAARTRQAL